MSKWNRWKLIHKETGLTFNQYAKEHTIMAHDGRTIYENFGELRPVLLRSGIPAVYVDTPWYPYMFFLVNKEWEVIMKPATPVGRD